MRRELIGKEGGRAPILLLFTKPWGVYLYMRVTRRRYLRVALGRRFPKRVIMLQYVPEWRGRVLVFTRRDTLEAREELRKVWETLGV